MICLNEPGHGRIIAQAAGCNFDAVQDVVVTRVSNGQVLGGIIYQDYNGASISMHVASFTPRWGSIDLLWMAFDYPFNQLGCSKVLGFVPSHNKEALAFDYKLGFKYVTTVPGVFLLGDLIILEMNRTDCKWLKLKPRRLRGLVDGQG